VASPLLKFVRDLFEIEIEILRGETSLIILADYRLEWNPEFSKSRAA
jgi:hypothetical protein